MKLYLDDERRAPPGWILIKHPDEIINHLKNNNVKEISLDHDLGIDPITGYDVLLWIEEKVYLDSDWKCPEIKIHTANSSARKKMELAVKKIKNIISKNIDNKINNWCIEKSLKEHPNMTEGEYENFVRRNY